MTGPHLLAAVAYDEYYNDLPRMMSDIGKLLHQNFKRLAAAGCKHIQIDEPYFTVADDHEVRAAVDAINLAIEDLPADVHVLVHVCQGNYAVGPDYDGQIGHRYFDTGRYKADIISAIECDAFLIEHDMTDHYEEVLGNKQLGVGAVDVQDPNIETGRQVADRIKAHTWLVPEQTHHHQFMRVQSSAETCRAREASGHAGGESHPPRNGRVALGPVNEKRESTAAACRSLQPTAEHWRLVERTAEIGMFELDLRLGALGRDAVCRRPLWLRSELRETVFGGVGAGDLCR